MTDTNPESAKLDPDMVAVAPVTETTEPLPDAKPEPEKAEAKPEAKPSRREQIEASLKKLEGEAEKPADAKPDEGKKPEKPEAKAEPEKAAEPVKADDAKEAPEARDKREEKHPEPPARFTDEAKALYRHTPRPVKAEVERLIQEYETASAEFREAKEFADEVKPYREMAKQAGTSVKAALDRYVAFDRQIHADFGQGVAAIAKDQGKQPVEAIASLLRAYGITPQQYAQHVTQNPQAHQIAPAPQRDPAIQQVIQTQQQIIEKLQRQEQEAQLTTLQSEVDKWGADKPDYKRLEGAIAEILKSGIIENIHGKGLSVVQRLDAAYKMAGGTAKALDPVTQPTSPVQDAEKRSPSADAGKLSITGGLGGGKEPTIPHKSKSRRASIEAALARLSAQ